MKISILIPCFNVEDTIRECLDSIVAQDFDDYDIMLVDDGSTDNTLEIIKEYASIYTNIRYLENDHLGIAETLNFGLYECLDSDYTIRIDADDIMAKNRLKHQYNYMETNKHIDILGSGMKCFGDADCDLTPIEGEMIYTKDNLCTLDNTIYHPSVIMRNESLKKMDWFYSGYFNGAEDTEFWLRCQRNGLNVYKEPTIVTKYRVRKKDNSKQLEKVNLIRNIYFHDYSKNSGDITAVINFKNEGVDVEKTIMSIRATTSNMPIVVVNDASDDNYDYEKVCSKYNVEYYKLDKSRGASQARAFGADMVKTTYFVFLDAHMRFYTFNWDKALKNMLKTHNKAIICTDCLYLKHQPYDLYYENEDGSVEDYANGLCSPYIRMDNPLTSYIATFQYHSNIKECKDIIEPCSCVLGACYAMSKDWWQYIHGYKGLKHWGYEEPLISIKTWLLGGECLLLHGLKIGHCFRKQPNVSRNNLYTEANRLFVMSIFEDSVNDAIQANVVRRSGKFATDVLNILETYRKDINEEKEYIEANKVMSIEDFKKFNAKFIVK